MSYFPSATGDVPLLISRRGYGPTPTGATDKNGNVIGAAQTKPASGPSTWDKISSFLSGAGKNAVAFYNAQQQASAPPQYVAAPAAAIPWVPIAAVGGAAILAVALLRKRKNPGRRRRR